MGSLPPFIVLTPDGPFCTPGGFHIDPWRAVDKAVITHAHSDHAVKGCRSYLCSRASGPLLRARLGSDISLRRLEYGERIDVGDVAVSLHPAGHVLGAAQVRIEYRGHIIVFSGDYKLAPDPTAAPFEPVRCHTFITESTFGLPIFRWESADAVFERINDWWRQNQRDGRTSVIFAYSLGKSQRVLRGLDPSIGPIGVHGAIVAMNEAYTVAGVPLPRVLHAGEATSPELRGVGMVITPIASGASPWLRRFSGPDGLSLASVSGWMLVRGARRRQALDRGFAISDHADWDALNHAIELSGAEHVGVTHGYTDVLARWLAEGGVDAFVVPTRYTGESALPEPIDPGSAADLLAVSVDDADRGANGGGR
ncbi:MAG: ligase-associated DNA damage response exonuclease [Phycisphaerales bacterium]